MKGYTVPVDYTSTITEPRRKDRQTDDNSIKAFLKKAPYCTIAHLYKGQPFIHSNTFYYDEDDHAVYFHTAAQGRFRFNTEQNNQVCFSVSQMGRLLPAKKAMNFSVEYEAVMIFGTVDIMNNSDPKTKEALQLLLDKYFPHLKANVDYTATTDQDLKKTTVYRLNIEQWSGKRKAVERDCKGAFFYREINDR